MAKNKTGIEFEGFEEVLSKLKKLDGDIKGTSEEALVKTKRYIHKNLGTAMEPHNRTYKTVQSLVKNNIIKWNGNIVSIDTGFDISHGGLPSVFLMYGTPRMDKDQKLYNAIFGAKTKREVMKLQEDVYYEEIRRVDR